MNTNSNRSMRGRLSEELQGVQCVRRGGTHAVVAVVKVFTYFPLNELVIWRNRQRRKRLLWVWIVWIEQQRDDRLNPLVPHIHYSRSGVRGGDRVLRVPHHIGELRYRWCGVCPKNFNTHDTVYAVDLSSLDERHISVLDAEPPRNWHPQILDSVQSRRSLVAEPFNKRRQSICTDCSQRFRGFSHSGISCTIRVRGARNFVIRHPRREAAPFVLRFGVASCQHDRCNDCCEHERGNRNFPPAFHAHRVGRCPE
jgi:hypothetical protein